MVNANALFQERLPIQKEIDDAAKKAGSKYPAQTMTEGWIGGMAIEAALKGAGWPADAAKVRAAMENLKIDTKGLRGGPIESNKDNGYAAAPVLVPTSTNRTGKKIARVRRVRK